MKKLLIIALFIVGCEETLEPQDCAGVAGGTAIVDACGVCDGIDGYVAGSCYDCADTPNGDAVLDDCGVCDGSSLCLQCTGCNPNIIKYGAVYEESPSFFLDCDQWIEDSTGCALNDILFIKKLIQNSVYPLTPNDSPFSIGSQLWKNGRLIRFDYPYVGGLSGCNIPTEINNLDRLEYFRVDAGLSGTIPKEIGELNSLKYLILWFGDLSGEIPKEIANIISLRTLYLSSNNLSGSIPEGIQLLENLELLFLNNNILEGVIPNSICDLNLIWEGVSPPENPDIVFPVLDLKNNQLCPPYPDCLTETNIGYQDTSNCPQ